ncbi:MAG: Sec-independent protein translocase protein TatB [Gallionellaceae bacterium]|nr:Sec-independent protein translocase protein TatB [Gallionellaceae bacterium]
MFDIGFSEILVIAVVALVVIGPERLPSVARTLGHLWGRVQRYVNGVKADISRDMALEELRQVQQGVQEQVASTTEALNLVEQELDQHMQKIDEEVAKRNQSPVKHFSSAAIKPSEQKIPEQQTFPID